MKISPKKKAMFQKLILDFYESHKRDSLPWRKKISPYRVYVSEIMLQQTQTSRVVDYFNRWMKQFPTIEKLASASQIDILRNWKGLGYNSRALRMKQAALIITKKYQGKFPKEELLLQQLPGIGPYTASAICAFAYNQPTVMIETNIRRVYLHHFFQNEKNIHDREILVLIKETLDIKNPREWYFALMDYGAYLGETLMLSGKKYNPNKQSRHYTKQTTFKGSDREIRGKILEVLLKQKNHVITFEKLYKLNKIFPLDKDRTEMILETLSKEKFISISSSGKILLRK